MSAKFRVIQTVAHSDFHNCFTVNGGLKRRSDKFSSRRAALAAASEWASAGYTATVVRLSRDQYGSYWQKVAARYPFDEGAE